MAGFFALLTLGSLIFLVAGLIKPSIPNNVFRQQFKRRSIALLFGSLTFVFFILIGVFAKPTEQQTTVTLPVANNVQQVAPAITEPTATTTDTTVQEDQSPVQPETVAPKIQETLYAIVSATDGDTFKVSINGKTEIVRAIGIDTPETVDPRKPVQCFGAEASKRAKELLTGKKVKLEADTTQGDRDKYSRLLRYAWIEDGTFFNKQMILDGYAVEYTYNAPYKYQAEFKQAEAEARAAKRGLWADNACPQAPVPTNNNTNSAPAPTPVQPSTPKYDCSANKYNCTDFKTQKEAQAVFEYCGGLSNDIHRLDADKNGQACESLP